MEQEVISVSRLTSKYQATVPRPVRDRLGVGAGDSIAFVIDRDGVRLRRADPLDREYARALSDTMGEWLSPADEEAYRDL
ncbi:MAG: AbrB family transcriptional regulator [Thermoleophilia bacterium]|nr:AbrB family transcriptional regulator [Thermoleophilia bacterium]